MLRVRGVVFESGDALGEVAIRARTEGEIDGRADERGAADLDAVLRLDQLEHRFDGPGRPLLQAQRGV